MSTLPNEAKGKSMITTLAGTNTFLIRTELHNRSQAFVKEYGDLAVEKLDGEEASFARLSEALQSLPFLSAKKLVVVQNPGANKEFNEQFESLLPTISETNDVILVESKPDKRTVFYKALKNHTDFHELNELSEQDLPKWLVAEAKARGGSVTPGDASYLVRRVGTGQLALSNELDKLLAYQPQISRETIDLLTEEAPRSTIFELIETAFAGNHKRALQIYKEQRVQKVEPQQIMAMVAWQLHVLALVKAGGERSADEIAKEAKLNPFVVRKSQAIARKLSMQEIKNLISRALNLDVRLKSEAVDADEAMQHFLLTISS